MPVLFLRVSKSYLRLWLSRLMRQTFADFFAVSGSVLDVAVVFVLEFVVAVHGGSDFYIFARFLSANCLLSTAACLNVSAVFFPSSDTPNFPLLLLQYTLRSSPFSLRCSLSCLDGFRAVACNAFLNQI